MVQSLLLFWPLMLLAVAGTMIFLLLLRSGRKERRRMLESRPDFEVLSMRRRADTTGSAVVRPTPIR